MLDGLLGRGFSSKCKSSIKQTKARIEVIRRKRNAMQRFLKKDIADLLSNGLDINAYGRAEGFYVEINLSSCYDFVEQFCGCIPLHLSVLQKQRECPEECRVAISSLMFAAARFADLPELRDLRDMFTERYGNSLDSFVNQEFVENLASKPPTIEKKLQLMREIAKEFSIKWDSKAFEQKISSPVLVQEQPKTNGFLHDRKIDGNKVDNSKDNTVSKRNQDTSSHGRRGAADEYKPQDGRVESVLYRDNIKDDKSSKRNNQDSSSHWRRVADEFKPKSGRDEVRNRDKQGLPYGRLNVPNDGYTPCIRMEENVVKGDDQELLAQERRNFIDKKYKIQNGGEETSLKRDNHDVMSRQKYPKEGFIPCKGRNDTALKRDDLDRLSRGRRKHLDHGENPDYGREVITPRKDYPDVSSYRKQEHYLVDTTKQKVTMNNKDIQLVEDNRNGRTDSANVAEAAGGAESLKPRYNSMIPPYVKPNVGSFAIRSTAPDHATSDRDKVLTDPPVRYKDIPTGKSETSQAGPDGIDFQRQGVEPARVNRQNDENYHYHQEDLVGDKKPKPKSVRRRHLKPPSAHVQAVDKEGDEILKRKPSGRRREDARRGLQHALDEDRDQRDEEERMMDKLLVHYSKKPTNVEPTKLGARINASPSHDVAVAEETPSHRRRNGVRLNPEPAPRPTRAVSLPPEPVTPTEVERVPARATSFQQDILGPGAHVHPKLPDYDDLAARFAALKGR